MTFWSRLGGQVQWLSAVRNEVRTRTVRGAYNAPPTRQAIERFLKVSER